MSPLYDWIGPGETKQRDLARTTTPQVTKPASPTPALPQASQPRWVCAVEGCGRKFKKAMIAARHFNSAHETLKQDKDSWREWVEQVTD